MSERSKIADGSVSRRGDRWLAQLPPSMGRAGKILDTEDDARLWLRQQTLLRTLGVTAPREGARLTVSELIDQWLSAHDIKETTREDYRIRIDKHVKPKAFGALAISEVLPMHVDICIKDTPPNWTRVHVAKILKQFFEWAEGNRLTVGSPYRQSNASQMIRTRQRAAERRESVDNTWTPEQLVTFIEYESDPVYRDYWTFVAATGARRGEAIGMRWANLSADKGWCWLEDNITTAGNKIMNTGSPKNHKRRKAYFGPVVSKVLLARRDDQDAHRATTDGKWSGDWVFDRRRGKGPRFFPGVHLAPATVTQRFNRQAKELGLPELGGPHGLRRAFATMAEIEGFRPSVLVAAMGHAPDTTGMYTKASVADLEALAARLADLILPHG
jgi:integrase